MYPSVDVKNHSHIVYVPVTDCLLHRLAIHTPGLINDIHRRNVFGFVFVTRTVPLRPLLALWRDRVNGKRAAAPNRSCHRVLFNPFWRSSSPRRPVGKSMNQPCLKMTWAPLYFCRSAAAAASDATFSEKLVAKIIEGIERWVHLFRVILLGDRFSFFQGKLFIIRRLITLLWCHVIFDSSRLKRINT